MGRITSTLIESDTAHGEIMRKDLAERLDQIAANKTYSEVALTQSASLSFLSKDEYLAITRYLEGLDPSLENQLALQNLATKLRGFNQPEQSEEAPSSSPDN